MVNSRAALFKPVFLEWFWRTRTLGLNVTGPSIIDKSSVHYWWWLSLEGGGRLLRSLWASCDWFVQAILFCEKEYVGNEVTSVSDWFSLRERERYRRRYCLCRLVIMLFHCFGLGERWPTDNLPLMQYHNSRVHMTTGTRQLWGNMWKNQQGCGVSARYTWHVFLAGVLRLPPALMATSCNQNFDFDVEFIPMETEWEREN